MKINNSIHNEYVKDHLSRTVFKGSGRENESVPHSQMKNAVYDCDKKNVNTSAIKTTAGENPSGRLSFKGKEIIITKSAEELKKTFAGKLAMNKSFNWFLDRIASNTLLAEAIFALGLTSIIRPAAIYAIPAKNKEEKKKNNYQVAHSIATGLLGLGTTVAVSVPIKKGVEYVMNNQKNYFKKHPSYITDKNKSLFKETANRLHQPFFLPLRAILTIMIVPPLLKAIFGIEKNPKKQLNLTPAEEAKIDYSLFNFKGDTKKAFQSFAGMTSAAAMIAAKTKEASPLKPQAAVSFKGKVPAKPSAVTKGIAWVVGKVADTKAAKNFVDWFGKTNWFPHLIAAESLLLSGFYMQQTAASKKIEKDQKPAMMLNQGITAVACTAGAYVLDKHVNNMLDKFGAVYKKLNPTMEKEAIGNKTRAIRLLGPIVIFTAIYRFIGPVLVTPVANYISDRMQKKPKVDAKKPA